MNQKKTDAKMRQLRKDLDRADKLLLKAFAARFRGVRKIAEVKRRAGLSVVQKSRWKEVLRTRVALGRKLGLPEKFVREVFAAIHKEAIRLQKSKRHTK